jgi:recombination protein RecR
MPKSIAGPEIERLIQLLAKVPGLGPRSARRAALHLIKKKEQLLGPLASAMAEAVDKVRVCSVCGNVDTADPCNVCTDPRRDDATLIVVEDVADLWALERAGAMNARFHVLGGTLSPLDGVGPDDLRVGELLARLAPDAGRPAVEEVIVATSASVEGEATAMYLARLIKPLAVRVTRIASGIPVGGELEYSDQATIARALAGRAAI